MKIYPIKEITIKNIKLENSSKFERERLSIKIPKLPPKNVKPQINDDILENTERAEIMVSPTKKNGINRDKKLIIQKKKCSIFQGKRKGSKGKELLII